MDDFLSTGAHLSGGQSSYEARRTAPGSDQAVSWRDLIGQNLRVNPELCDIWSGNTRDLEALKASPSYAELRSSIAAIGQQVPAIARVSPDNPTRLQLIAGASRATAVRDINAAEPGRNLELLVELRTMSDDDAFRLVNAENSGRSGFSPIEKARMYREALPTYGTEAALAEGLSLNKSTVNRTLDILRLPTRLMELVADERQISAAQADRFMKDWNEPNLQATLATAIAERQGTKASAAVLFAALKQAVEPSFAPDPKALRQGGLSFGEIRRAKGGGYSITLNARAAADEPQRVAMIIMHALSAYQN